MELFSDNHHSFIVVKIPTIVNDIAVNIIPYHRVCKAYGITQ